MTLDTITNIANIGSFFLALFVAFKAVEIKNALTINSNEDNSVKQNVKGKNMTNNTITQNNGVKNND